MTRVIRYQLLHQGPMGRVASIGWASVRENTLKDWLRAYPVMNECTHFMCIMDAQQGTVRFLERGVVLDDDIEEVSDK